MSIDLNELSSFIVRAKAATYVGDSEQVTPCRLGSHDLRFSEGDWAYHDSYFGGADFIGEEVVYFAEKPVWAMNYYGRILRDELLTGPEAGQMIKASLSRMYQEVVSLEDLSTSKMILPTLTPAKATRTVFMVESLSAVDRRLLMSWSITAA